MAKVEELTMKVQSAKAAIEEFDAKNTGASLPPEDWAKIDVERNKLVQDYRRLSDELAEAKDDLRARYAEKAPQEPRESEIDDTVEKVQADELEALREQKKALDEQTAAAKPSTNDFDVLSKLVPTKESAAAYLAAAPVDYFPNMRKLNIGDLGKLAKLVGSNLKELMPVFAPVLQGKGKLDTLSLISELEVAAPKALAELYDIVVGVSGLASREEFEAQDLEALPYFINKLLAENNLTAFLSQAFKLGGRYTANQTSPTMRNGI